MAVHIGWSAAVDPVEVGIFGSRCEVHSRHGAVYRIEYDGGFRRFGQVIEHNQILSHHPTIHIPQCVQHVVPDKDAIPLKSAALQRQAIRALGAAATAQASGSMVVQSIQVHRFVVHHHGIAVGIDEQAVFQARCCPTVRPGMRNQVDHGRRFLGGILAAVEVKSIQRFTPGGQ